MNRRSFFSKALGVAVGLVAGQGVVKAAEKPKPPAEPIIETFKYRTESTERCDWPGLKDLLNPGDTLIRHSHHGYAPILGGVNGLIPIYRTSGEVVVQRATVVNLRKRMYDCFPPKDGWSIDHFNIRESLSSPKTIATEVEVRKAYKPVEVKA